MSLINRGNWWPAFFLIWLMAACGGSQNPDLGDPATLGERTFIQWCAPCHGASGEGFVNALNAPALNADSDAYRLSDEEILAAIIDGGAESGGTMNPLGDFLEPEQIEAVLEYVYTLWTEEQREEHEETGRHQEIGPGD
jgi:mono/diheme cytochrome c family protein